MIKLYIPLETQQNVPQCVVDSILSQTVVAEIVECRTPGITKSQRSNKHRTFEANSRNLCVEKIGQDNGTADYYFMQDSDIRHLCASNFADMILFLETNPAWGGVDLYREPPVALIPSRIQREPGHVRMSCCVLRKEFWNNIRFETKGSCLCTCVSSLVRGAGFKYGYLDIRKDRIIEIMDRDGS